MPGKVILERKGPLAIVRLNDPGCLNAVDAEMLGDLRLVMDEVLDDDSVRAVLLTGEGRGFCAGANLVEMNGQWASGQAPDAGGQLRDDVNPILVKMAMSGKPIIAAVNGPAAGVGCGIASLQDHRRGTDLAEPAS